jgi:hypothetical protein
MKMNLRLARLLVAIACLLVASLVFRVSSFVIVALFLGALVSFLAWRK